MSTERDTAPETAQDRSAVSGEAGSGGATRAAARAPARTRTRGSAVWRRVWAVAVGDLPSLWAGRPASAAEAVRYGRYGEYAAEGSRWRAAGTWYALLVAGPATAGLLVVVWVVQRPGRLAAAVLLAGLVWLFLAGVPLI